MIQNVGLATPVLHNVADAIANGVDPDEFVAAMHCNPQGDVWRNAEGVLLHDCGNCGRPRTTNGDCEYGLADTKQSTEDPFTCLPESSQPVAEMKLQQGADGNYFLEIGAIGAGLWRIEPDGTIGSDSLSREGFVKTFARLRAAP